MFLLALLAAAPGCGGDGLPAVEGGAWSDGVPTLAAGAVRGACLVFGTGDDPEYDGRLGARELRRLSQLGVRWISMSPHGRQDALGSTRILYPDPGPYHATEGGMRQAIRQARGEGFSILLQPTLWLREDLWRGEIRMAREEDWRAWFASYRSFLLHYARLAAEEQVDMLSVGLELRGTVEREADWRALIAEVRGVFSGPLTYAANWWREVDEVPFWDALDRVGVQFFYPLSDSPDASDEDLRAGLGRIRAKLEALSESVERRYLFTEVGYRSEPAPWMEPWVWRTDAPEDGGAQARCARLVIDTFHDAPGFAGLFWWNWYLQPEALRPADRRFSPQGKPAEPVLAAAFRPLRESEGSDEP